MIFVIGARGRLGNAIVEAHPSSNSVALCRTVYNDWWRDNASASVSRYFDANASAGDTIFIASGELDPSSPIEKHLNVNFQLPRNVIDGVAGMGINVVTFGTVMETFGDSANNYVHSKVRLGEYVESLRDNDDSILHLRIHTLYGGDRPNRFMFLGQILHALLTDSPFKMTLGRQLREYHHVVDDVQAVKALVSNNARGVINLSHGNALRLADLATTVFSAFDKSDLLQIGAIPEPETENYNREYARESVFDQIEPRESMPAVVEYLKECLANSDIDR